MRTLIREVMLPAAASVGFLVALATAPAEAEEASAATEPVVTLASATSAALVGGEQAGSDASDANEAAGRSSTARDEQRCRRVVRIGKFATRHCR